MRYHALLLCSVVIGCGDAENRSRPDPMRNYPLGCFIESLQEKYEQGNQPRISVRLVNLGGRPIEMVGGMDASDCLWRYPHCYFEVIRPNGELLSPEAQGSRCSLFGPLDHQHLIPVPPGQDFDPYQSVDENGYHSAWQLEARHFEEVGEYRIRFVYSSESADIEEWAGDPADARLVARFANIPKTAAVSGWLTIRIVPVKSVRP